MTIDTRDVNSLGPGKFRTQAINSNYNKNKRDKKFNCFLAVGKQPSTSADMFSIVNLLNKTNKNDNVYFETNDELSDFNNDSVQYKRPIQRVSESNIV